MGVASGLVLACVGLVIPRACSKICNYYVKNSETYEKLPHDTLLNSIEKMAYHFFVGQRALSAYAFNSSPVLYYFQISWSDSFWIVGWFFPYLLKYNYGIPISNFVVGVTLMFTLPMLIEAIRKVVEYCFGLPPLFCTSSVSNDQRKDVVSCIAMDDQDKKGDLFMKHHRNSQLHIDAHDHSLFWLLFLNSSNSCRGSSSNSDQGILGMVILTIFVVGLAVFPFVHLMLMVYYPFAHAYSCNPLDTDDARSKFRCLYKYSTDQYLPFPSQQSI